MRIVSLIFLIGYGMFLFSWMGRTPAYDGDLRAPAANGDEVLIDTTSMYDHSRYLFEIGYTYVFPDIDALFSVDAPDTPPPSFEEVQLRAQQGLQYLEQSVEINPKNAHTWMTIAWAHGLLGAHPDIVFEPLRTSWELAPYNRILADRRLALVATMLSDDPEAEGAITESDRENIARDMETMSMFEPRTLRDILEIAPDSPTLALPDDDQSEADGSAPQETDPEEPVQE